MSYPAWTEGSVNMDKKMDETPIDYESLSVWNTTQGLPKWNKPDDEKGEETTQNDASRVCWWSLGSKDHSHQADL